MYTIFIFVVTFITLGIYLINDTYFFVFRIVVSALVGLLFGLLVALIIPADTEVVTHTTYIEAMQDGRTYEGEVTVGIGSFHGKMKYVFYYETLSGYALEEIDAKDVIIKYTEGEPRMEVNVIEMTDAEINKFVVSFDNGRVVSRTIYVPKGTIQHNYKLDAQ